MTMAWLYAGLVLLVLALVLIAVAGVRRRASGLPGGRVILQDTHGWGRVEKALYDPELKLTGKPDYLIAQGGHLIPVEVKSGRTPSEPHDSHIFQLAAYCLLVEREYGKRPPHGVIHYPGRDFAVDYTPELESALLDVLAEMRQAERRKQVARSHEQAERCRRCGFGEACDERLE